MDLECIDSYADTPSRFQPKNMGVFVLSRQSAPREPVVTILYKNCHQYRVPFYTELRTLLAQKGIELRVAFGDGVAEDSAKGDVATLNWAEQAPCRTFTVFGRTLLWQPAFRLARQSDLVISEQASKQLFNVFLGVMPLWSRGRHAYWGHGRNFQASIEGSGGETLKKLLTRRAHWFFAYNDLSAEAAVDAGAAASRTTSVMNSTDTTHIRTVRQALPPDTSDRVRAELGMGAGPVALYLGGIYTHKRPEFLVDAAERLRNLVPDVEVLVIGDGSAADLIEDAANEHPWFHHVGAQYGDQRIRYASVADIQLMPGLVGLNVVDGFALGVPTITTGIDYHSPEIDYLIHDVNGIVANTSSPQEFAAVAASLLNDTERLSRLKLEAELSGRDLSIEDMAQRFADGVVQALRDRRSRGRFT